MAKGMEKWNPQVLKAALAKAQDSIFGLVIQDQIESLGKSILLKGDEVLMMIWLLKCLVVYLQNPQQLSLAKTLIAISVPPKRFTRTHRDEPLRAISKP
jgi:hypothetical protein